MWRLECVVNDAVLVTGNWDIMDLVMYETLSLINGIVAAGF